MGYSMRPPAVLMLEDGTLFNGKAVGVTGKAHGEICFNTGMTGYQEIFTDPSYYGQILVTATAHIGNYGTHDEEVESDRMKIAGLVCRNFSETYSRFGPTMSIQERFEKEGMVGISDVDTRAVVRHIRNKGAMNALIASDELDRERLREDLDRIPSMEGLELASRVTTNEAYTVGDPHMEKKVAVIDLGCKQNIVKCLTERGCYVKVFPMDTAFDEVVEWGASGVVLSNGPGDPAAMPHLVEHIRQLVDSELPVFGICLGHQLVALSQGLKTEKMHSGHRGINHPVKNLWSGKGEITSQNHGFVVQQAETQKEGIELTHQHLNDGTVAGLAIPGKNTFSVQYHPEASPGPHDPRYLFDDFLGMILDSVQKEAAG